MLEDAREALGENFVWRSVKMRVVGGVLQWQPRLGEWLPVNSPPSGDCQHCTQRGSQGGARSTSSAPTNPGHKRPPPPDRRRPRGGGSDPFTLLADLAKAAGPQRPMSMNRARRMKVPSYRSAPVPGLDMGPGFSRWHPTQRERARLLSLRHWHTISRSGPAWG